MIINPDKYLYDEKGVYKWTPERIKTAWEESYRELDECIEDGFCTKNGDRKNYRRLIMMSGLPASGKTTWVRKNKKEGIIYFDATFTNKHTRKLLLDHIRHRSNMPVEAVVMDTPIEVCKERNAKRTEDRQVPDDAYDRMHKWAKRDGPPTEKEGFCRIRNIITEQGEQDDKSRTGHKNNCHTQRSKCD